MIAQFIFVISMAIITYTYIGYPLCIAIRSKLLRNNVKKDTNFAPFVSVVMAAHNEEYLIGRKILNILGSNYPADKIEIIIGSDGSTDGTNEIISNISDDRVKAFIYNKRRGKPSTLNDVVPHARGDILVLCDARQIFDPDSIRQLVANFADSTVGCVSGELIFTDTGKRSGVAVGVDFYWRYEKYIRICESKINSMVGATGAIYAIRKDLFPKLPSNVILDDAYAPLEASRKGYRCLLDPSAIAYDKPARNPKKEYRRKVRTLAGNYQIFVYFKDLLIPFINPVSMPLISHKLLRVLCPFFMIIAFIANVFLIDNAFYTRILLFQVLFYMFGLLGALTYRRKKKILFSNLASIVYVFCLMNYAALVGFYRFVFDKQNVVWER